MAVPNVYQTTADNKIVSLSLSDTATGKGYITLYGAGFYNGSTGSNVANYALLPSDFPAGKISTGVSGGSTTNFDVRFLKPIIIEGNCFVTYTCVSPASVGGTTTVALIASGAVVSNLVSASGALVSGGTTRRQMITLNVPRTVLKKDDVFRVQIQIGNQAGETTTFYHDPKTRIKTTGTEVETGATENTDMIVNLPIKII